MSDNFDEQYLTTRRDTRIWQQAQIERLSTGAEGEGTLEQPSTELAVDVPKGKGNTDLTLSPAPTADTVPEVVKPEPIAGRKEFTVDTPEVQELRTQAREQLKKIGTGEVAVEEVGKAGRKLAEALHPGVAVAGRALGLDEEGADALATGFVEFLAGLPGKDSGELSAGIETALAAVPMVGAMMKSGKMAGMAAEEMVRVFHGSPHKFDKFDISKIGSGEGAQAFGHGLYFAENPEVAKGYAKVLPVKDFQRKVQEVYGEHDSPEDAIKALAEAGLNEEQLALVQALEKDDWLGFDYPHQAVRAILSKDAKNWDPSPETLKAAESLSHMYHVDIPKTAVEQMLDWDSKLKDQHPTVQKAVRELLDPFLKKGNIEKTSSGYWVEEPNLWGGTTGYSEISRERAEAFLKNADPIGNATGKDIKLALGKFLDKQNVLDSITSTNQGKAEAALKSKGVPGIKYADAMSRDAAEGETTRNFVVFDDSLVDIKQRSILAEFKKAVDILKSERGSISLGKAKKEKLPGASTPVTWEEAVKIDESSRAFEERLKTFSERLSTQRRGVRSDVQVTADSMSPEAISLETFLDLPPGTILKDSDVVAAKRMFKDLAEPVRLMAKWVSDNPNDQQAFLSLLEHLPKVDEAVTRIAGAYAESGRTQRLLSQKLPTGGNGASQTEDRVRISDPYIQQWMAFFQQQDQLAAMGAPAMTKDKFVQVMASMESPEELMAAAKVLAKPTKWDMFMEYWINGLLSGPQTHATNVLSNAATIAWAIPERALASMFSRSVRPSESLAMLGGILEAQGDAWRLAWLAFKKEESQLGVGKLEGPARAITADALELTGVPGRAVDFLGSIIRLPGRALLASDDYFKAVAFRAELRALAKRESFKQVMESGLTGQAARNRMRQIEHNILTNPPESIEDAAKEFASYVTFTRDLGEAGQKIQAAFSTPVGRIVLPFVRTPTNIFKYAGERTPLAFASAAVRDEIAAGGERRALALAKISLGAMTMGYMGTLAAEGILTGGGPKDKALRAEWMATGKQPYSIKVGDTYYRYSRIEPLGSLLGLAADAADLMGQLPEKDADQLASALVVALSRNVAQKTFVKGVAGTLNAVSSQDINIVQNFLEKELPTILPASTAMGQVTREVDPVMREVNSLMDAFKARVPGLSDSLPPRRNLWGEAIHLEGGLGPDMISPFYSSSVKDDKVSAELVRLELGVSMPSKQIDGVPLTPQEYDAFVVLQGSKPIIGDITLKQRLSDTMKSDLYKRSSDGPDGGKAALIRQWVSSYRDMAKHIMTDKELSQQYLQQDFPELRDQLVAARDKKSQMFNAPAIR